MTEHLDSVLEELVPGFDDEHGDWERVLRAALPGEVARSGRSGTRHPRKRLIPRRRLAILVAVVIAIGIPLGAAAAQDWWFFRFPGAAPSPTTQVSVVKSGAWDGKPWQLVAYRSATDGICFALTPATTGPPGDGAALSCAQIEGVPRTEQTKPSAPYAITFLAGSSLGFPAYVVGPVIDTADQVEIHLASGEVIRTPTFGAPGDLGSIRFYAAQVPEPRPSSGERPDVGVEKLVGLTDMGEIVACLVVPMPEAGVPLSACR